MENNDHAILVGISRYRDVDQYPTLKGPLNDVERVRAWLTDAKSGEGIPSNQVLTLTTKTDLLGLPPFGWPQDTVWAPSRDEFSNLFTAFALDEHGEMVRRDGRLFLYFSGHGFSLNDDDKPSAALFSAENYGRFHRNLAGTVYAAAAQRARLFSEVVLIMDCCRDVLSNQSYDLPDFDTVENNGAESTRVSALYAAPRRGKSQERELPTSGGKIVGVLTDAFLRALKEAPADVSGRVGSRILYEVIKNNWQFWYPIEPEPPLPRTAPPDGNDIYFKSPQRLIPVEFRIPNALEPGTFLKLRTEVWNAVGREKNDIIIWTDTANSWKQEIPISASEAGSARRFTLLLPAGNHTFILGPTVRNFNPEEENIITITL